MWPVNSLLKSCDQSTLCSSHVTSQLFAQKLAQGKLSVSSSALSNFTGNYFWCSLLHMSSISGIHQPHVYIVLHASFISDSEFSCVYFLEVVSQISQAVRCLKQFVSQLNVCPKCVNHPRHRLQIQICFKLFVCLSEELDADLKLHHFNLPNKPHILTGLYFLLYAALFGSHTHNFLLYVLLFGGPLPATIQRSCS